MKVLHLITQRSMPPGQVRQSCEMCGVAIPNVQPEAEPDWTDDPEIYDNCEQIEYVRCIDQEGKTDVRD